MSGERALGRALARSLSIGVVTLALACGCGSPVRIGAHDSGPGCASDDACGDGNQCVCGRCFSLDLLVGACDPACADASPGDLCTSEGRVCDLGPCTALVCTSGSFQLADACDAGVADAGVVGETCGRVVCGLGTVCCNPSCGTCAAPEDVCITDVCAPDCSAQDAYSGGMCAGSAGWAFDGTTCRELACSCVGTDCANVFAGEMECLAYFGTCGAPCGGFLGRGCASGEYCAYGGSCGAGDMGGTCRTIPSECPPETRLSCGCDGTTYSSPCDATLRGIDVAYDGPCGG